MFCDLVTNTVVQKITSDFSNSSNQFDLNSPIEESEVVSVCQGLIISYLKQNCFSHGEGSFKKSIHKQFYSK